MAKPSENTPIHPRCFGTRLISMRFFGRLARIAGVVLALGSVCYAGAKPRAAAAGKVVVFTDKQLEKLSRALKQPEPQLTSEQAYAQLSSVASQKSAGVLGMRAALAIGYFDYTKGRYAQAEKWLSRAKSDPLLGDYALYWLAETDVAQRRDADALAALDQLRKDFPDSVMIEQALEAYAQAALASNRPADAITALNSYTPTEITPSLLFFRAQAREQAGQPFDAAEDYEAVYLRFPASDQAHDAARKLDLLKTTLGDKFPALSLAQRVVHAETLFTSKIFGDARNEYAALLPELSESAKERAQLRILECGVSLGASPSELIALQISDPDVEAERSYALADYFRDQQQETPMLAAVETAASRAPSSRWTEAVLFLAGNYYWVQLERDRASGFYKRVEEQFPDAPEATAAQWRVAWTAVLKRQPEAAAMLREHLQRFPGSPYTPDALYWLGRLAEEANSLPLARTYYSKLRERYPENYFTGIGSGRLSVLGLEPEEDPEVLATIPPVSPAPKLDGLIPQAAAARQARADALRSIAFDSSAELELRAGYAATGEPRLLLEAAQAAVAAGHYGPAMLTVRQVYPQLESRPFADVPRDVWLTAYALPFEPSIRRWSARAGLDPMLVAGLIHQESVFEPEARSNKNAIGLMQILPTEARLLARESRIGYSRFRLTDPDYNIRLGTTYFADLLKQFGRPEMALAAYNAGEDRVALWTSGQNYRETAEFVDSIPFTETRQYVQIIMRNADIYRRLYGAPSESRSTTTYHRLH